MTVGCISPEDGAFSVGRDAGGFRFATLNSSRTLYTEQLRSEKALQFSDRHLHLPPRKTLYSYTEPISVRSFGQNQAETH